jgi:hypothetical protein
MPALRALPVRSFLATSHLDTLSVDKRIGNLAAGFMQVAPCSFARDPEFFCGFFLFKSFQIDKPYQFDLLGLERDTCAFLFRTAAGLVAAGFSGSFNDAPDAGPSPPWAGGTFRLFAVRHAAFSCD